MAINSSIKISLPAKMLWLIVLLANWLKTGNEKDISAAATKNDSKQIITDSPKNWSVSWLRAAPITFRTPTSFARSVARAVVKLIKLTAAIFFIDTATTEKI